MDPQVVQIVTTGGATGVLLALVVLLLRGDLVTKAGAEARVAAVTEGFKALVLELTTSRDEWKGIARDSLGDVGSLSEALTVRNRIDEALTKRVDDITKAAAR